MAMTKDGTDDQGNYTGYVGGDMGGSGQGSVGGNVGGGGTNTPTTPVLNPGGLLNPDGSTSGQTNVPGSTQGVTAGRQGTNEGSWVPYQDYANVQSAQTSGLKQVGTPNANGTAPAGGGYQPYSGGQYGGPAGVVSPATPGNGGEDPTANSGAGHPGAWGAHPVGSPLVAGPGSQGFYGDALSKYLRGG